MSTNGDARHGRVGVMPLHDDPGRRAGQQPMRSVVRRATAAVFGGRLAAHKLILLVGLVARG
jgi:hypothetical protein